MYISLRATFSDTEGGPRATMVNFTQKNRPFFNGRQICQFQIYFFNLAYSSNRFATLNFA